MIYTSEVENMCCVLKGADHGPAPIPEEGKWVQAKEIKDISGLTHGIGWCAPQQGTCKLSLNVKDGIIQEALVETIGCSGMTHSAAMAAEILPKKTILEALNTDLVCDAINTAMRELFLQIVYGRTQTAFSEGGLPIGAGLEDLGKGLRSMTGTTYGTAAVLNKYGIDAIAVKKIHENEHGNNTLSLIESGKIQYVISTSAKGRIPSRDSVKIRRKTVERNIPCLTSLDTANALADCLKSRYSQHSTELVDINNMRDSKLKLRFTKMQGIGNDYIYFSTFDQWINNPEALAVRLSDRHFGVGADGVILVAPSKVADAQMKMYNRDGSEGKMCGNGIRCVGKFLYDHGMVDIKEKDEITVETLSGIKKLKAFTNDGEVTTLRVDMGKAILRPEEIPVALEGEKIVDREVKIAGKQYNITCVSMGNPHCVVFRDDIDRIDIEKVGPEFEFDPLFPERVNTEFVTVLDDHTIKMRVWERGSGETWACGTGACAAAVAAVENGFCKKGEDIKVKLIGGDLVINYTDETVYMTGNAEKVFEGEVVI